MIGPTRRESFVWRVEGRDGQFGPPVRFVVSGRDAEYLRAEWDDIDRMPRGEARSRRVRALQVTLDLFATFGGEFVDEERLAA